MVGYYLQREGLSELYGWKPRDIDEMLTEDLAIYFAILKGKNKMIGKQDRRKLK